MPRLALVLFAALLLGACEGDPGPIVDASHAPDAPPMVDGAMCEGTLPFLDECSDDSMCASCICHTFGRGTTCTQACDGPEDCPPPSSGCGGIGLCRPP